MMKIYVLVTFSPQYFFCEINTKSLIDYLGNIVNWAATLNQKRKMEKSKSFCVHFDRASELAKVVSFFVTPLAPKYRNVFAQRTVLPSPTKEEQLVLH